MEGTSTAGWHGLGEGLQAPMGLLWLLTAALAAGMEVLASLCIGGGFGGIVGPSKYVSPLLDFSSVQDSGLRVTRQAVCNKQLFHSVSTAEGCSPGACLLQDSQSVHPSNFH